MKSFFNCIFFWLCVFTVKGQGSPWSRSVSSGQLIPVGISTPIYFQPGVQCIQQLPVVYRSFDVKRLRSKVDLVWETTFECNNNGFEIQRKIGNGEWRKVAFVFSQAKEGNSSGALTYEYTDVNTGTAPSQYRLKQFDLDRSITYSDVCNIAGY